MRRIFVKLYFLLTTILRAHRSRYFSPKSATMRWAYIPSSGFSNENYRSAESPFSVKGSPARGIAELKAMLFSHNSAAAEARDTNFPRNISGEYKRRHETITSTSTLKVQRRQLYEATACNYLRASNDRAPSKSQPIFQSAFTRQRLLPHHSLTPCLLHPRPATISTRRFRATSAKIFLPDTDGAIIN